MLVSFKLFVRPNPKQNYVDNSFNHKHEHHQMFLVYVRVCDGIFLIFLFLKYIIHGVETFCFLWIRIVESCSFAQ